jgi:hypothetical protein
MSIQANRRLTADEIVQRGEEIYEREVRTKVEAVHHGEFLALDVRTGAYETAPDDLTACKRLLTRVPDAEIYGLRVGYDAAYELGRSDLLDPR